MTAFTKIEIRILADSLYYKAWQYIPVLCAAMLFCSFTSFMGSVYTVKQKSKLSFWTALLGAGVNIVLNALLIPSPLGLQGAALATFASYFVVFIIRSENVRHYIPFRLFKKELFLCSGVLLVQILFICFGCFGWQGVQFVSSVTIFLMGRKKIAERITAFRQHTGGN